MTIDDVLFTSPLSSVSSCDLIEMSSKELSDYFVIVLIAVFNETKYKCFFLLVE